MHTTPQLLDALARKLGGVTDYRLAKVLGTSMQAVAHWRKGDRHPSHGYAVKIAAELKWPAEYVLACVEHEREPAQDVRVVWQRLAQSYWKKLSAVASIVLAFMLADPSPAHALTARNGSTSPGQSIHYTKYEAARRRRRLSTFLCRFHDWLSNPRRRFRGIPQWLRAVTWYPVAPLPA